ncbi:MAG: hypothetical protein WC752_03265 [Patescibacteria group bacterium]|jgi:DNA-binding transcriptional ArsR family regulator
MLEQLFGSRTRVKLLRLFCRYPEQRFFVRELTRKIDEQINSIRRELANLEKMGLLKSEVKDKKKYYQIIPDFILYPEIKALILKSRFTMEREFVSGIKKFGTLQYLALCGYFVDDKEAPVDLFIVGRVSKKKLADLLEKFNRGFGYEVRFTVMDIDEYKYRKEITDKFLYEILNRNKIIVVDKLNG